MVIPATRRSHTVRVGVLQDTVWSGAESANRPGPAQRSTIA